MVNKADLKKQTSLRSKSQTKANFAAFSCPSLFLTLPFEIFFSILMQNIFKKLKGGAFGDLENFRKKSRKASTLKIC